MWDHVDCGQTRYKDSYDLCEQDLGGVGDRRGVEGEGIYVEPKCIAQRLQLDTRGLMGTTLGLKVQPHIGHCVIPLYKEANVPLLHELLMLYHHHLTWLILDVPPEEEIMEQVAVIARPSNSNNEG